MQEFRGALPAAIRRVVDDTGRLNALAALAQPTAETDGDFDRLSRTAARLFHAELGFIALVGSTGQQLQGTHGAHTISDANFAAHTLGARAGEVLFVPDTTTDPRFADSPLVTGGEHVRFFAGVPITYSGHRLGALCVLGTSPQAGVSHEINEQMFDLAALASTLFGLKDEARVRARTAAALMREEWRHALTLEAGKVGSWVWDIHTDEVSCNDMFRRMYDLPESGPVYSAQVLEATHPADRRTVEAGLRASISQGVEYDAEARVAANGRWLSMRGRVYQRDADGRATVMMGASIDISESKESAERTRILLRELNHRVKNTLAMIQSVARQTIRQNPDPQAFINAFSGRLRTISDAHVLLADRDWMSVQLYEVIASQLGPNFLTTPDRANVRGDDVSLPADHALGLGLILHELTTNAHRHGAWSNHTGIVNIEWHVRDHPERGLELTWREEGGPRVVPQEYGLGAKLIERSLAKVLDSRVELSFDPEGVRTRIWLPLP